VKGREVEEKGSRKWSREIQHKYNPGICTANEEMRPDGNMKKKKKRRDGYNRTECRGSSRKSSRINQLLVVHAQWRERESQRKRSIHTRPTIPGAGLEQEGTSCPGQTDGD